MHCHKIPISGWIKPLSYKKTELFWSITDISPICLWQNFAIATFVRVKNLGSAWYTLTQFLFYVVKYLAIFPKTPSKNWILPLCKDWSTIYFDTNFMSCFMALQMGFLSQKDLRRILKWSQNDLKRISKGSYTDLKRTWKGSSTKPRWITYRIL